VKVDDDGLAFTGQGFSKTLGLDPNLQLNSCASSGFTGVLGLHLGHLPFASLKKEISETAQATWSSSVPSGTAPLSTLQ
jgi:hypothetical protein